jgi:hypothetical protein
MRMRRCAWSGGGKPYRSDIHVELWSREISVRLLDHVALSKRWSVEQLRTPSKLWQCDACAGIISAKWLRIPLRVAS